MTTEEEVQKLRAEIAHLSGTAPPPMSKSKKYLAERLAELRQRVSVSLSLRHADELALARIADSNGKRRTGGRPSRSGLDINVSRLVRDALAEYAANRGFASEAELLREGTS